jgi:sec-independent protein translocase protein TatA
VLLVVLLLLVFGAKRLPEVGRSLGRGMREFKDGITCRSEGVGGSCARRPTNGEEGGPGIGLRT